MKVQGAVIKEQGLTFSIVVVKPVATQTKAAAAETLAAFEPLFPPPLVLASQDSRGRFTYLGRRDIVQFLSRLNPASIPWREYTFT